MCCVLSANALLFSCDFAPLSCLFKSCPYPQSLVCALQFSWLLLPCTWPSHLWAASASVVASVSDACGLFLGLLSFCPGVLEDRCFSFSSAVLSTGYYFQVLLVMWKDFWISSNLLQILGTKEDWGRNREVFLLRRLHAGLTHLHFSWWPELVICPYAPARSPLTKIWFGSQFISRKGQSCPPFPPRWGSWLPEALP